MWLRLFACQHDWLAEFAHDMAGLLACLTVIASPGVSHQWLSHEFLHSILTPVAQHQQLMNVDHTTIIIALTSVCSSRLLASKFYTHIPSAQAEAVTHTAFGNGTPAATCKLLPIFHKCIRADGLLLELLFPDTPPFACLHWLPTMVDDLQHVQRLKGFCSVRRFQVPGGNIGSMPVTRLCWWDHMH